MSGEKKATRCRNCGRYADCEGRMCPECRAKIDQRKSKREEEYRQCGWNMALYHARIEAGLSRRELAKLAGVSDSTYAKCESGQGDLSEPNRARVARVLKKPVEALWDQPYKVRCRTCLMPFSPVRGEKVCQACREDAQREARRHGRQAPGSNQKKIATIARMARRQGMTYGEYVARERMERHG